MNCINCGKEIDKRSKSGKCISCVKKKSISWNKTISEIIECKVCREEKNKIFFPKTPGGYRYICKECTNMKHREYIKDRSRKQEKQEKVCKFCNKVFKANRIDQLFCSRICHRKHYNRNRGRDLYLNKYKTNVQFKLSNRMSWMIRHSIKNKNRKHWEDIIDYTLENLIEHLEKISDFTIQDYLEKDLHLDHIIPISVYSFESYEDEEFKKCWNLRNLRLITAEDNRRKYNKFDKNLVEKYDIKDLMPK